MLGDGVIAESVISFKVTWKNPGNGEQPKWNQNDQEIFYHKADIYPDLLFTKAQGIATYYTYTTIDAIVQLLKKINAIIDSKLSSGEVSEEVKMLGPATTVQKVGPTDLQAVPKAELQRVGPRALQRIDQPGNTQLQTVQPGQVPAIIQPKSITNDPKSQPKQDDVTIKPDQKDSQEASSESRSYTVTVYGKELKLLDAQLTSANIRVRHRVSANLFRKVNDEILDNSKNIWLETVISDGRTIKFEMKDFETEAGENLLVQILPTVDLILTPGKEAATPKSEETINLEDKIRNLRRIRQEREEQRFERSKEDTEKRVKRASSYWKKSE